MNKKLALILSLIVVLPTAALGWFGARMAQHEQQAIEMRVRDLLHAQLTSIDGSIQSVFHAAQQDLLAKAQGLGADPDTLREFARRAPRVQQVFVIAPDGKRQFPPPGAPTSYAEARFLERSAAIWDNPHILLQSDASDRLPAAPEKYSKLSSGAGHRDHGWYAWHWNAELHHIFWVRGPDQRLTGFELSPVRIMADIVARLPSTGGADDTLGDARIRLFNANGQVAYQWGAYEPGEKEAPQAMLPLSHPLSSWRLEYFAPPLQAGVAGNRFGLAAGIFAFVLALAGLAWYLYREQTREMRLASQRVNFVNQVSHELKTPLTNIRMYAELLEDELDDDADKPRRFIGIISAESQRLSRLIANVLNFARAQKQTLTLHAQPGVVDQVIARCIDAFAPALAAKHVEIRFDADASQTVEFDAEILEQILNNLFSNVEKYAAAGGAMEVASSQQDGATEIRVRDFGPGIDARERERIFQPFYRIDSRLNEGVSGTGIGLSIARDLARLHGGDLMVEPMAPGACFVVTLATVKVEDNA